MIFCTGLLLGLTGCSFKINISIGTEEKTTSSSSTAPFVSSLDFSIPVSSLPVSASSSSLVSSEDSSEEISSVEKPETVTIFSLNDIHGSLDINSTSQELGLARLDYAIKYDPDYDPYTSLIISAGDSWQGGYIASREMTLTDDLLSLMGVSCMTLGNHEFDWGIPQIESNKESCDYPYLGCNVLNPDGTRATFCDSSFETTIGNVKYGIIGAIGAEEESDIDTVKLANYSFSEDTSYIQNEVDKLKQDDCDIIVLDLHDGCDSDYTLSIGNTFTTDDIAGIFGGHSHTYDNTTVGSNALPYVQAGCNTKGYSKMTFNVATGKVISQSYVQPYQQYHSLTKPYLDTTIVNKIETANETYEANDTIATLNGTFRRYHELDKLVTESMICKAQDFGYGQDNEGNELLAIHNEGGIRNNLPSGNITMIDLYKTSPFSNNLLYFESIPGSQLASILGDNPSQYESSSGYYAYMRESDTTFDSFLTYSVVVIDYVYHTSYWKSAISASYTYTTIEDTSYYTIDCLLEHMRGKTFNASDYR